MKPNMVVQPGACRWASCFSPTYRKSVAYGATRCRGVALITALLVVALAATASASMVYRQQLDIRRTGNTLDSDQAALYALGIEVWSLDILNNDLKNNITDSLEDDWATVLPPFEVDGGVISGYIEDGQARFNINNLVDSDGQASEADIDRFNSLLNLLEIDADIADAIVDWIDPDIETRLPTGAEDENYLQKDPPYRVPNQLMTHPSELRLVEGVTAEIYRKLEPYITALPDVTPINVNTAPAMLLRTLSPAISESNAEELIQLREDKIFESAEDFLARYNKIAVPGEESKSLQTEGSFAVSSSYFVLRSNANIGRIQFQADTLISRPSGAALEADTEEKAEDADNEQDQGNGDQQAGQGNQGSAGKKPPGEARVLVRGWGGSRGAVP